MTSFRKKLATGLVGMAVVATPFAMGADKKTESTKPAAAKANAAKPGMVVVKDPATGQLRAPTAEEHQALTGNGGSSSGRTTGAQTSVKGGAAATTQVQHPDGTVSVMLDESHAVFAVATRTPEGKVVIGEVTGAKAADAAVSRTAKTGAKGKAVTNNVK